MRRLFQYLLLLLLFWMGLFLLQHTCFLFNDTASLAGLDVRTLLYSYQRALPMDLAAACYLLLPVALLCIASLFTDRRWPRTVALVWIVVAIVLSALINVSDIALFHAWGTKINHKALSYLAYPEEAAATLSGAQFGRSMVILVAQVSIALIVVLHIDHHRSLRSGPRWARITAAVVAMAGLLIGARGGVQDDPIDRSWSYHSARPVLNLAALNGVWNVIVLLAEPPEFGSNPYAYMDLAEAQARVDALHAHAPARDHYLTTLERPNVVMVLLESWTADVVGVLDGDSGVTPGLDRLAKEGLLFTNFHSTGFRTEQGLCGSISGFPAQPRTTIIRQYGKFDRLPSLVAVLDSMGYRSTYYYAGDVVFANTRAYLESMGFDVVHDEHSFPIVRRTRWGAFDEELFAFHLADAHASDEPFFHLIMTSTSHEPFDAPVDEGFSGDNDPQRYRNTVHYTDRVLADFMDRCKAQPWYPNTLFIIVADHGHFLPRNRAHFSAERHRIPLLFTGGALRPELRGTRDRTFGTHVDIPSTVLGELGVAHERFPWSKDLFDRQARHFAFWTFDDGFGIADETQTLVLDNLSGNVLQRKDSAVGPRMDAELLRDGQALEQILLERYIHLSQ
ncbi:MAG: LTA synthase family protein [Flavobacteriales bacterium]|nr:LTA synthase family protein [Flavobacteriales bacterium]